MFRTFPLSDDHPYLEVAKRHYNRMIDRSPEVLERYIRIYDVDFSGGVFTKRGLGRLLIDLIPNDRGLAVYVAKMALCDQRMNRRKAEERRAVE